MIETKGLDSTEVLVALHQVAKPTAIGVPFLTNEFGRKEAADMLRRSGGIVYFDCPTGIAKIDLTNPDQFNGTDFDKALQQPGAARKAIREVAVHA